ncbi:MAG TPA: MBL fold metallo-hydrolase, partial [Myxococcaceae bacterium]|nr:MBL fold metallo-hydrolase [Myxococcaceae bacterium]
MSGPARSSRLLTAVLTVLSGSTPAAAETSSAETGVRDVVERYFRADALGSAGELKDAFAPGASILEKRGSSWVRVTPEALAARVKGVAADESRRVRRVETLRVNAGEASVRVTVESPRDLRQERLTLRSGEDGWRIVADRRETTSKPSPAAQVRSLLARWVKPVQPFRLLGNVHYVGANGVSAFLLTTPAGHVLLDSGPVEMLPRLERNVEALGFHLADVKLLLNSHAHYDHCGGFAELKRRTGARLL